MEQQQRIEKAIKDKQQRIDKAIAQKEKSIAYFNSVNAAIKKQNDKKKWNWKLWEEDRDKFYLAWQNWYLENMIQKNNNEIPL